MRRCPQLQVSQTPHARCDNATKRCLPPRKPEGHGVTLERHGVTPERPPLLPEQLQRLGWGSFWDTASPGLLCRAHGAGGLGENTPSPGPHAVSPWFPAQQDEEPQRTQARSRKDAPCVLGDLWRRIWVHRGSQG